MRETMWVYGVIVLLVVSEAWSLDSGTNQSTSVNSNTTPSRTSNANTVIKDDVYRNEIVNPGTAVNLTCVNKTWSEMMFTIWKIGLNSKNCTIGFSNDGQSHINTCNDGKALHNTSSAESYLVIPNFSNSDEGVYKCESVYTGGRHSVNFNVSVTVSPKVSAWLEWQGNNRVAVCLAAGGKPAASIVWRNMGNSSSVPTVEKHRSPDGSYTVRSQLDLPEGMATGNLTCAVGHASWKVEWTVMPELKTESSAAHIPWVPLLISVSIVILLGFLYFALKKLIVIRHCWQSSTPPSESKSPPAEDVEEVEPYASYIQRVNSIYNSSADLFT